MVMRCFGIFGGGGEEEDDDEQRMAKSASVRSAASTSTDVASGSDFNSRNISDISGESAVVRPPPSFSGRPANLRSFTLAELKAATKNFAPSQLLGEGGFGSVFRGTVRSSPALTAPRIDVAVKQLCRSGTQGHKEWMNEVSVLGIVDHPNLVKLIGFCAEDDERGSQRLLVYDFMANGSVDDHLSARSPSHAAVGLSWPMRLKVALDAARGLTYLHEGTEFQIIFRDLKTSNILLDENWNAKLSDFGFARQGPEDGSTHVSTAVVGTLGYAAPEYVETGRLTAKSDSWSYGVVLYELITGRRPIDLNRPRGERKLLEWLKPYATDANKFGSVIDPRIAGECSVQSAMELASVANKCLVRNHKNRPKMSEVLQMMKAVVENAAAGNPRPALPEEGRQRPAEKRRWRRLLQFWHRLQLIKN